MYPPAVLQTGIVESPTPLEASLSSGFCSGHTVFVLVRPVVPYTLVLSSQRSRPVPWPVILGVLALLPPAVDRADDVFCSLASIAAFLVHSGLPQIRPLRFFSLAAQSLRSCGQWFITYRRYPHSAIGRWCLRLLTDR